MIPFALAAATYAYLRSALGNTKAADEVRDILEINQVLSAAEAAYIDGVTAGTGAAGKAIVLDSSGDWFGPSTVTMVFGHTATLTISDTDGSTNCIPQHQIVGTTKAGASLLLASANTTNDLTVAPSVNLLKNGHADWTGNTVVASGEILGEVNFFGADGADLESCAVSLKGVVNAAAGAGDMAGRFVVFCSADGAETPLEKMRVEGAAATALVTIGVAGTSTGNIILAGATSGTVALRATAAAGDVVFILPAAVGSAGQQLTTDGNAGTATTSWAAASLGSWKNDLGILDPWEALKAVVSAPTHRFTYNPEAMPAGQSDGSGFQFTGIFAEEAPWAMYGPRDGLKSGIAFSPVNAFGYARAAIQALYEEVQRLKAQLAAK